MAESAANRIVLTSRRNDCSEVFALTEEGRAFQAHAAANGKARSPVKPMRTKTRQNEIPRERKPIKTNNIAHYCESSVKGSKTLDQADQLPLNAFLPGLNRSADVERPLDRKRLSF